MEHESFEDPAGRGADERGLRQHQGRPRGAARHRPGLHDRLPDADRRRRLAADHHHDPRQAAVLRRHLLPAREPLRPHRDARPRAPGRQAVADRARQASAAPPSRSSTPSTKTRRPVIGGQHRPRARSTAPSASSAAATTRPTAASARRPSSPRPTTSSSCPLLAAGRATHRRWRWCRHTLEQMRLGGIYDQVGFGFHRYSTDAEWLVPHFEKMLYDQALLVLASTEAWLATGEPGLRAHGPRDLHLRSARHDLAGGRLLLGRGRRQRGRGGALLPLDHRRGRADPRRGGRRLRRLGVEPRQPRATYADEASGRAHRHATSPTSRRSHRGHGARSRDDGTRTSNKRLESVRSRLFEVREERDPPAQGRQGPGRLERSDGGRDGLRRDGSSTSRSGSRRRTKATDFVLEEMRDRRAAACCTATATATPRSPPSSTTTSS